MFLQPIFWCCCLVAAIVYRSIDNAAIRTRATALSLINLCGLAAVLRPSDFLALGIVVLWCWLAGNRIRKIKPAGLKAPLLALSPIAIYWIVGKHDLGAISTYNWLTFIGTSFVLVKCWTLFKDCADGRVGALELEMVCSYLTFFPCFVMGPMHTYNEFRAALGGTCELSTREAINLYFRIAIGLAKIYIIAPLLSPMSLLAVPGLQFSWVDLPEIVFGAFVYSIVIFCDFSGFSDLAIATARIIGVRSPENFSAPYFAPSIREFWNRWHISFSRVLTSYVFIPISRSLSNRFRDQRMLVLILGYLATFLICGYWHGPSLNFVIWGLYHAVGLIGYDRYRAWKPKPAIPADPSLLRKWASIALTFTFVSLGWIPFVLGSK